MHAQIQTSREMRNLICLVARAHAVPIGALPDLPSLRSGELKGQHPDAILIFGACEVLCRDSMIVQDVWYRFEVQASCPLLLSGLPRYVVMERLQLHHSGQDAADIGKMEEGSGEVPNRNTNPLMTGSLE